MVELDLRPLTPFTPTVSFCMRRFSFFTPRTVLSHDCLVGLSHSQVNHTLKRLKTPTEKKGSVTPPVFMRNHTLHRHKRVKWSFNGFCRLDSLGQFFFFFTGGNCPDLGGAVCAASSRAGGTKSKFTLIEKKSFFNRPLIWSRHAGPPQTKRTGAYYKNLSLSKKKKKEERRPSGLCCFSMHLLFLSGSAVFWHHNGSSSLVSRKVLLWQVERVFSWQPGREEGFSTLQWITAGSGLAQHKCLG